MKILGRIKKSKVLTAVMTAVLIFPIGLPHRACLCRAEIGC